MRNTLHVFGFWYSAHRALSNCMNWYDVLHPKLRHHGIILRMDEWVDYYFENQWWVESAPPDLRPLWWN